MSDGTQHLHPDTILARLPALSVRLQSNGEALVGAGNRRYLSGAHTLSILDVFSRPVSLAAALSTLQGRTAGAQDWIDLTETMVGLYKAGLLVEPENNVAPEHRPHGFDNPTIHISMLNDCVRTSQYIAAIEETVRPGDVVVDLGTGTGILAAAASRAGARHVYAIEAGGMSRFARALFDANSLGDRITLLQGWSTQVDLPEKADVLVSEIIGNDPLSERVLEATLDARKRFLKPGARFVPGRVRILCVPMSIPSPNYSEWRFTPEAADRWKSWYGIDFSALVDTASGWSYFTHVPADVVRAWEPLGPPVVLADLDLSQFTELEVEKSAELILTETGTLDGLVLCFELTLGKTTTLSMQPSEVSATSSWRYPVWLLGDRPYVTSGDGFRASYRHRPSQGDESFAVSRSEPG